MSLWRKPLILLLLMLLPLQGMAAAFAPLHRMLAGSTAVNLPCHEQQAATGSAHHHDGSGSEHATAPATHELPRDTDAASHLCCHQVLSCSGMHAPAMPSHKFSDVSRFVLPLATLFIPESPDRPPRR